MGLQIALRLFFTVAGETMLGYSHIDQPSLQVSGGIILFFISLYLIPPSPFLHYLIPPSPFLRQPALRPRHPPQAAGPRLQNFLGQRRISAMEKFMGLLLNLMAVNMTLQGIRGFLS